MRNRTSNNGKGAAFRGKVALAFLLVCIFAVLSGCSSNIMTSVPDDERETGEIQGDPTTSSKVAGEARFLTQVTLRGESVNTICTLTYNDQGLVSKVESNRNGLPYVQSYTYDEQGATATMSEQYEDVLISYTYNSPTFTADASGTGTYIQSWSTEGSPSGTIGGRSVYTTKDDNSRCEKLETTVYYSTGKSSLSVYEFDDEGRITSYAITNADGNTSEEAYRYPSNNGEESMQVTSGDRELLFSEKVNQEGQVTSLVNRRTGVALLLVYGEKLSQPTDFSRMLNQINLSQFYTMAVGAALTNWDEASAF